MKTKIKKKALKGSNHDKEEAESERAAEEFARRL